MSTGRSNNWTKMKLDHANADPYCGDMVSLPPYLSTRSAIGSRRWRRWCGRLAIPMPRLERWRTSGRRITEFRVCSSRIRKALRPISHSETRREFSLTRNSPAIPSDETRASVR